MKRNIRSILYLLIFVLVHAVSVFSQGLPAAAPEEVGLSSERLDRIGALVQEYVDQNQIAGAVALVSRHGRVAYLESFGMMDIETQKPMRTDTIFRLASMTKPLQAWL